MRFGVQRKHTGNVENSAGIGVSGHVFKPSGGTGLAGFLLAFGTSQNPEAADTGFG